MEPNETDAPQQGESNSESGANVQVDTAKYVEAINTIKKNSVSRQDYDKLKEENRTLLESIINQSPPQANKTEETETVDLDKLRKEMFSTDSELSNLEYVEGALKLRKTLMDKGEPDPFLPWGEKIIPSAEDEEAAERVAKIFQECVDYAQGNSEIFTNELMRRTVDAAPTVGRGGNSRRR